jgi:hypothetical protein
MQPKDQACTNIPIEMWDKLFIDDCTEDGLDKRVLRDYMEL